MESIRKIVEGRQYWMATEVKRLMREKARVDYSLIHVTRLLHRWGFSRRKLDRKRVKAASERQVRRFKKAREAIVRALERGLNVVRKDESIFVYDSVLRYVWAKRGSELVVSTTGSHRRTCFFGVLSIDGRQLFRQRSYRWRELPRLSKGAEA
jgi:hypothetical protein